MKWTLSAILALGTMAMGAVTGSGVTITDNKITASGESVSITGENIYAGIVFRPDTEMTLNFDTTGHLYIASPSAMDVNPNTASLTMNILWNAPVGEVSERELISSPFSATQPGYVTTCYEWLANANIIINGELYTRATGDTVNEGEYTLETVRTATGNSLVVKANVTKAVPEPTTATLSLLALAGLAARRRRK